MTKPRSIYALLALIGIAALTLVATGSAQKSPASLPKPSPAKQLSGLQNGTAPTDEQQRLVNDVAADFNEGGRRVNDPAQIDPTTARVARSDESRTVIIVGNGDIVCLIRVDGARGAACQHPELTVERGQPLTIMDEPGGWMDTLVPDDAKDVLIETSDGETLSATPRNNVVSVRFSGTPRSVSWTASDGKRSSAPVGPRAG